MSLQSSLILYKIIQSVMLSRFLMSNLHRIKDIASNYRPLESPCQRVREITKQAYLSATDYHNGVHYSKLTDLTSFAAAKMICRKMEADETGRLILEQKPRITDEVFEEMGNLPDNTFGRHYFNFMKKQNFKPSERPLVEFIPDLQYAYVLQRYKEIHDFLHILLAKKISVDEQLQLKWFEMRQLGLPSATLASLISPILSKEFSLSETADLIRIADRSRFMMNIYYEHHFDSDIVIVKLFQEEVRRKLGYL